MILDAILGLFVELFAAAIEAVAMLLPALVNVFAAGIELVVGLFVTGFSLGRMERKKRSTKATTETETEPEPPKSPFSRWVLVGFFLLCCLVTFAFEIYPKIMNRTVTLVAEDGHSLPYAAMVIHSAVGDEHNRTNGSGGIVIPRFDITALTLKDPRYIEKTWQKTELQSQLIVQRSLLGSGLDKVTGFLLKPAKQ